jgi:hypothetical protein
MRRAEIQPSTIEAIVLAPERRRIDDDGNSVAVGRDERDRTVEVVLASDVPGYVITVIVRRKPR